MIPNHSTQAVHGRTGCMVPRATHISCRKVLGRVAKPVLLISNHSPFLLSRREKVGPEISISWKSYISFNGEVELTSILESSKMRSRVSVYIRLSCPTHLCSIVCVSRPVPVVCHNRPTCFDSHFFNAMREDVGHGSPVLHSVVFSFEVPPRVQLQVQVGKW